MDGIYYGTEPYYKKIVIWMIDPLWPNRRWYLKKAYNGSYDWTRDATHGKDMTPETAKKHLANLKAGADKDWKPFHDSWAKYYQELK